MVKAFKDHFSARAADYARYRPSYPPALAAWLAGLAPARELALDCGCGAGQLSVLLADVFARVVATDASAEQIRAAKPHARVEYRVARAEEPVLPAASADLLTVAQSAHWFDLDAFYAQARRVLKPSGVVALVTYGVIVAEGAVGRVLDAFYHDVLGGFWPPERRHVETGYRALPFPFEEIAAPDFAMRARWSRDELLGYVDTWSAVRALEAAQGRGACERFAEALCAAWGDPGARREIRWPLSLRVGRV
jgi:SAM-dependent methyltransferase